MSVIVIDHLTLDGVLQGPGRPDEDPRDGFEHGGWAVARGGDPEIGEAMGQVIPTDFAWLFGRVSYDGMLAHWNGVGGPFRDGLNDRHKYVATSRPDTPLTWPHSEAVTGDVPAEVARLRDGGRDLVVMGSGELVRSLLPHGLVDRMLLLVHPVVLGSGLRLFGPSDQPVPLRLVSARSSSSGVALLTYER